MKDIIITLLFLASSVLGELCGPENHCQCSPNVQEATLIDCRSQTLTAFLKEDLITEKVESVYMNDNQIKTLTQIPESQSLVYLNFANNLISTISFDAFDNLDELKTLVLTNNKLTVISDDIFEWNPLKLEVLYLDGNELEFIQHFLFYDLEKLTELYLNNNSITFIHPHAFLQLTSLRRLALNGNQLHTFIPKWINKLQPVIGYLNLGGNPWSCDCDMVEAIKWLETKGKAWFDKMTSDFPMVCEKPFGYSGKNLSELSEEGVNKFCDKPKIKQISQTSVIPWGKDVLLGCVTDPGDEYLPVAMVSWSAPNGDVYRLQNAYNFDGIEVHRNGSLKILKLEESDQGEYTCQAKNSQGSYQAKVTITITPGSIPDVKPPEDPEIDYHKVAVLVTKADPGPNVQVKDFDDNCPEECTCISQHLDCAGDKEHKPKLKNIPEGIPTSSLTINLALNKIESVKDNAFRAYPQLEEIRLDDNEIYEVKSTAFSGLIKLTTLTLRKNMLTRLEANVFKDLERLNVLVLDDNLLSHLTKDIFSGLESLSWVYIRNNRIENIDEDAFDHLVKIRFIHLEGNSLVGIRTSSVHSALQHESKSLQKIFLEDNNFDCNCEMEEMRKFVRDKSTNEDLFADGIKCFKPDEHADKYLQTIEETLVCSPNEKVVYKYIEPEKQNSAQLIGGIVLGVVLAFVLAIVWRKFGRRCRCNRSSIRGHEPARSHASYRRSSGDYTPLMSAHVSNSEAFI